MSDIPPAKLEASGRKEKEIRERLDSFPVRSWIDARYAYLSIVYHAGVRAALSGRQQQSISIQLFTCRSAEPVGLTPCFTLM